MYLHTFTKSKKVWASTLPVYSKCVKFSTQPIDFQQSSLLKKLLFLNSFSHSVCWTTQCSKDIWDSLYIHRATRLRTSQGFLTGSSGKYRNTNNIYIHINTYILHWNMFILNTLKHLYFHMQIKVVCIQTICSSIHLHAYKFKNQIDSFV